MISRLCLLLLALFVYGSACSAADQPPLQWRFTTQDSKDFAKVDFDDSGWQSVTVGHKWKSGGFAWFRSQITIPEKIDGKDCKGEAVGLRWNACDGGECYLNGRVFCRYDNDHPALVVLTSSAVPGQTATVAARVFMGPNMDEREGSLGEAYLCIIDSKTLKTPFQVKVDAKKRIGPMPHVFAGLSHGGGLPDYDDATAATFKEWGMKWFRMDNLLTNALKKNEDGTLRYDWTDLDKRLDFVKKAGCEFIFCISYMPEPLDAVPDGERHSYPRHWDLFGELVYQAAKHCIDRGTPVKYWEVWNEINTGWMRDPEGWDHLKTYTTLYDTCWKAVRRADPKAWIGGPCVASGPWNQDDKRGPGVNGEKFMRGLFEHCEKTGAPLDFVTWHEYFQPYWIMKKEAEQIRDYLKEYPKVQKQVKEFQITEWSYAWWHDRAHDNEVGAVWAAASVLRGWIPAGVQKPCWFYSKENNDTLRGDWAMFTRGNKPKAVGNVCKMFNMMPSERLACTGEDDQIASAAAIDAKTGRITVLVLNFGDRFGAPRVINLTVSGLPKGVKASTCKRYLVDVTHSNLANDEAKYELETVPAVMSNGAGSARLMFEMANNAVSLIELTP